MEIGPTWNGDQMRGQHEIAGLPVDFDDTYGEAGLVKRLVGRRVVGARIDRYIAYLRLDDGTHVAFHGISAQSEDGLLIHIWDDVPPNSDRPTPNT